MHIIFRLRVVVEQQYTIRSFLNKTLARVCNITIASKNQKAEAQATSLQKQPNP